MKWKKHSYTESDLGKHRVVTKFLFFPLHLGEEVRWLEKAKILQEFKEDRTAMPIDKPGVLSFYPMEWINIKFVD
jgi:hypothetical protein